MADDGGNLTDNGRITGSAGNTLTISGAQLYDSGNYQVVITNSFGMTNSMLVTLTVVVPLRSPVRRRIKHRQEWHRDVHRRRQRSAPFNFVWLKGGSPVSGGTSQVLTLANVQPATRVNTALR